MRTRWTLSPARVAKIAPRVPLKAASLRLLVGDIRKHYVEVSQGSFCPVCPPKWSDKTALKVIAELLDHAKKIWPSGLEDIAVLATQLIGHPTNKTDTLTSKNIQDLSHLYNHLLHLLAKPASLWPFRSVIYQQRAQFCLVRKMTTFKPHIPIMREGFRALITVQLAHRKTDEERQWAKSKALSWPPWEEQLLGIEAHGEAGKSSRANQVLSRMTEAGYTHLEWERAARILAGWDTDNSPTIQTRAFLNEAPAVRIPDIGRNRTLSPLKDDGRVWAARISATRTLKEAWACFTSYVQLIPTYHTIEPYQAMFFRLLYTGDGDMQPEIDQKSVVPGDGRETWPEPTSPHDFLYVSSDPPSIRQFWHKMRRKRLIPGRHLLSALLDNANTYTEGKMYLLADTRKQREKEALLGKRKNSIEEIRTAARTLGDKVVAAWIRLLCRAEVPPKKSFVLPSPLQSNIASSAPCGPTKEPFLYAQYLVEALEPFYRPIWYALFEAFSTRVASCRHSQTVNRLLLAWSHHLNRMDSLGVEMDFDGLLVNGKILEQVVVDGFSLPPALDSGFCSGGEPKLACSALWKSMSHATVYGGSFMGPSCVAQSTDWLPRGHPPVSDGPAEPLHTPPPSVLHRTVRILGLCEDHQSILKLLHWMDCQSLKLAGVAGELANSQRLNHYTMIAARYFLESTWRDENFDQRGAIRNEWQPGQYELMTEAKAIIERHRHDWGGWATDQDLHAYHRINQPKARRLRKSRGLANVTFY